MDWGDVPTWVQAIATLLALIAAGAAASAAWQVLAVERKRDVDRQQVEDERRAAEARGQADRVAAWPSTSPTEQNAPPPPQQGVSIRNASELPVYNVRVFFERLNGAGME